jgi:plastocyanin domain-containing protein
MLYAIINIIGALIILFIILWFFVLKSKKAVEIGEAGVLIKVNGGVYKPGLIQAKLGQMVTLTFIREDSSACAATVIFDGMDTSVELVQVNQPYVVVFQPKQAGEFSFHCSMNMYQGKLVVAS